MAESQRIAYLDHAASTPMRAEAVAAMLPFLCERYANPTGAHVLAREARRAVDDARATVAACLGSEPGEVVFTGCGTEADNLALFGPVRRGGGGTVCTAVEHHAVLHPVQHLGGRVVGVDGCGVVDLDQLADALDHEVRVVSVMAVNNEVGTVQPLAEVLAVVRDRAPQAVVHTDAIQAVTWLDLGSVAGDADLVSVSAHKFGGPKGVGALVVRGGLELEPLLFGGGQERERRSGTHNVAGIVAMAEALRLAHAERSEVVHRVGVLRDRLVLGLCAEVDGVVETVPSPAKVAGSAHLCFEGVESEALLYLLERGGVCASAGSSCASGALEMSHVLAAMGVDRGAATGAVRFSLGSASTEADVDQVLDVVPPSVARLRR